jgi:hypothetical protein
VDRARRLPTILVNSFPGEGASSDSDRYDPPPGQRILHVGPLFNSNSNSNSTAAAACTMWQADSTCMDWLDRQSPGSVVYVSFGSWVAPIGPDKIAEFALGLQAAGRPFLWVLKNHPSWRAGLPDGFVVETVAGGGTAGKVVPWAPQEEVLHHALRLELDAGSREAPSPHDLLPYLRGPVHQLCLHRQDVGGWDRDGQH